MLPAGPLMVEHRLIEKIVGTLKTALENIPKAKCVDVGFIEMAIDAMQAYADRCHHGKEEDILFRELKKKQLSPELKKILDELISEHKISRQTIAALVIANKKCAACDKDALAEIERLLKIIVDLYPKHIEKEDKRFFLPCMEYFTKEEQEKMLQEFWDFDRALIHEKYKKVLTNLESRLCPVEKK